MPIIAISSYNGLTGMLVDDSAVCVHFISQAFAYLGAQST